MRELMVMQELGITFNRGEKVTLAALENYLRTYCETKSYGQICRLLNQVKTGPNGSILFKYHWKKIVRNKIPIPIIVPQRNVSGKCACCSANDKKPYKGPITHPTSGNKKGYTATVSGLCIPCGDFRWIYLIIKSIEFDRWHSMDIEGWDMPWIRALYYFAKILPLPFTLIPLRRTDNSKGGKTRTYMPWQRQKAVDYTVKATVEEIMDKMDEVRELLKFLIQEAL
jgi:hypothetical protein